MNRCSDAPPVAVPDRRSACLWLLSGVAALGGLAAQAAGPAVALAQTGRPRTVVATTGQVADLVRTIAGDRLRVIGLLGEGVDPHTYRLTRSDTAQLLGADMIFYNGLLLEGKLIDVLVRIATSGRPVHAVTGFIPEDRLLEPEDFEGQFDPHVWMDPVLWAEAITAVRDRLAELDPGGAAAFTANAERYAADIARIDRYSRDVIATIPAEQRVLVTAHDAFNYLGRAYGLEVVGIQGISTESEAGLREIEGLVDLLVSRKVPAVFVETSVTDRNIRALIEGAAARGHAVVIGGSLYSDAMGTPGTYEGTYIGMMDHNVTVIARALGGSAPAGGAHGRLVAADRR